VGLPIVGDEDSDYMPAFVSTGARTNKTIISIVAGAYHNLVLTNDSTVYVWGDNSSSQLGVVVGLNGNNGDDDVGDSSPLASPGVATLNLPQGVNIWQIAATEAASFVLLSNGQVWAVGNGLGDNTDDDDNEFNTIGISGSTYLNLQSIIDNAEGDVENDDPLTAVTPIQVDFTTAYPSTNGVFATQLFASTYGDFALVLAPFGSEGTAPGASVPTSTGPVAPVPVAPVTPVAPVPVAPVTPVAPVPVAPKAPVAPVPVAPVAPVPVAPTSNVTAPTPINPTPINPPPVSSSVMVLPSLLALVVFITLGIFVQ